MVRRGFEGEGVQPFSGAGVDAMSEPSHDPKRDGHEAKGGAPASRPDDAELSARLGKLNAKLSELQSRGAPAEPTLSDRTSSRSGAALAFRLGAEFVSGVLVGSAIGYGIDYVFSASPWGLLIFTLIGFAAGVMNMLRAAGEGPGGTGSGRSGGRAP